MRPVVNPTVIAKLSLIAARPPIVPQPIVMIGIPSYKEIVSRFLRLSWHKREDVLKSLGIVVFHTNETHRYMLAFRSIRRDEKLEELVREIERAERL